MTMSFAFLPSCKEKMPLIGHIILQCPGKVDAPSSRSPRKKTKKEVRLEFTDVIGALHSFYSKHGGVQPPALNVSLNEAGQCASFSVGTALVGGAMCNIPGAKLPFPKELVINGTPHYVFVEDKCDDDGGRDPICDSKPPVLVVGAGGIGCELLKCLVLDGFRDIEIVDLDTIDATNLNRQFLFRTEDVGRPKAIVASENVSSWNPSGKHLSVTAHHGNIKEANFDVDFYKKFAVVVNGLDNISARKHVNRLCVQAGVPLVESGTMGFNGQVQPIDSKNGMACFDCKPRPSEVKTFAVCTIHARPTTMVHCTHYALEMYKRLFGDVVSAAAVADEMSFLEKGVDKDPHALFQSIFHDQIVALLDLKRAGEWTTRPPDPLMATREMSQTPIPGDRTKILTLPQLYAAFVAGISQCAQRLRQPFRKDDSVATMLVAATANLRALAFHIDRQSTEDVTTIAGAIVPAIATTNAVVAACAVAQLEVLLDATERKAARAVYFRKMPQLRRRKGPRGNTCTDRMLLHSLEPEPAVPGCLVCGMKDRSVTVQLNATIHTLRTFVDLVLIGQLCFVSPQVSRGATLLFELDEFESLGGHPLRKWVPSDEEGRKKDEAEFIVSDLNQALEWTVVVKHESQFTEVRQFVVDGTVSIEDAVLPSALPSSALANQESDDDEVVAYNPARKGREEGVKKDADVCVIEEFEC